MEAEGATSLQPKPPPKRKANPQRARSCSPAQRRLCSLSPSDRQCLSSPWQPPDVKFTAPEPVDPEPPAPRRSRRLHVAAAAGAATAAGQCQAPGCCRLPGHL